MMLEPDKIMTRSVLLLTLLSASGVLTAARTFDDTLLAADQPQQQQPAGLNAAQELHPLQVRAYEKHSRCWYHTIYTKPDITSRTYVRFMLHKDDGFPLANCDWTLMQWLQQLSASERKMANFVLDVTPLGDFCPILANAWYLAQVVNPIKCLMPDNVVPICVCIPFPLYLRAMTANAAEERGTV